MAGEKPYLSIIVPVYNERECLPILHEKIAEVAQDLGFAWEVIYVDDGSTDGSTDILLDLHQHGNVTVAVQRRNFGKSQALRVGFNLGRGKVLVTMDADLQDDPAEIPRLLASLDEGYDIISGWKKNRQDPLTKIIPSKIANRVTTLLSGVQLRDMNSGLKAYRAECVRNLQVYGDLHRFMPLIAHYNGFRVSEIPVAHHKRRFGHSKYGTERFVRGGLDLLTVLFLHRYGRRPLHFFGGLGLLILITGFTINLTLTVQWMRGMRPLSERPLLTLGVLLMVVGGQLITTGLLAELLVAHIQSTKNPLETVSQVHYSVDHPQLAAAREANDNAQ